MTTHSLMIMPTKSKLMKQKERVKRHR